MLAEGMASTSNHVKKEQYVKMKNISKTCLGFGADEGKCDKPTAAHSAAWCETHERQRRDHMSKRLNELAHRFGYNEAEDGGVRR